MMKFLNTVYFRFSQQMEKYGINMMRIALAIVFVWFGGLKVVGISPAEELVRKTVYWFRPEIFIPILGLAEVIIGFGLLIKRFIPFTIILLLLHMGVTFFPLFVLPNDCFGTFPYCPTMAGQYIIKNLVLLSGAFIVGGKYNMAYYNRLNN